MYLAERLAEATGSLLSAHFSDGTFSVATMMATTYLCASTDDADEAGDGGVRGHRRIARRSRTNQGRRELSLEKCGAQHIRSVENTSTLLASAVNV